MLRRLRTLLSLALGLLIATSVAPAQTAPTAAYLQEAFHAINTLQAWYNPATGLYQTTGYWNAANSLTVLANYSRLDGTDAFFPIFANTLAVTPRSYPGFLDGYYDDEGWWALAWIDVYDLTHQPQYLAAATHLFSDMTTAWDNTCGGGIWWNSDRQYKNAIANELFLSVAGQLAARATNGTDRATYLSWAEREWAWFQGSGMINNQNLINDGLVTSTCKNNGQKTWSYNQGVILGGLTQLNALTHDASLLSTADTIANAAIANLTTGNGILTDTCEPNCGNDGVEFKGVFLRNLMALQAVEHNPAYTAFIRTNADSVWNHARGPNYQLGQAWTGPFDAGNAGSQNSALDAILAAASTQAFTATGAPVPSFSLSASPTTLSPTPGAPVTTAVTLTSDSGFTGAVHLTSTVVGGPVGVSHILAQPTLTSSGSTTLTITTSPSTPGGTYLLAINGVAGSLDKVAYVTLALPDFTLAPATTTSFYLNQSGQTTETIAVNPSNGFSDSVTLGAFGLPTGVSASFAPRTASTSTQLSLSATAYTPTTSSATFSIAGASGPTRHTLSSLSLAVSAALSTCGRGTPVNLTPAFNLTAIHSDGSSYTDGGLDGLGFSFSGSLLGPARVLNGVRFALGTPNQPDGLSFAGQTVALPAGRYTALHLLGTGINGRQPDQALTITYTDGTSTKLTQSFADWYGAALNANETEAVAMPYRLAADGASAGTTPFNAYGYTIPLDPNKVPASLTLPSNRNVVLLAATLSVDAGGTPVPLNGLYNLTGLVTDGSSFASNAGIDGGGTAYSANLLTDTAASGADLTVAAASFHLAPANQPNTVYAAGQTIPLPAGEFKTLQILGTAINGNQLNQTLTVNYQDGSSQVLHQNLSDWFSISNFQNEVLGIRTAYRDGANGTPQNTPFNVYLYTYPLSLSKQVRSLTLPNNRNVVFLGLNLTPYTVTPSCTR